uniref:NB-ARC domain-containing protein n=1 Tax=Roseihalotalea indica TaxID=2867963 RepID=A0AA49JI65_9BACT|nr:NB-ARC domain-containing protein [Tunicatimonas sp. TK19036]
MQEDFKKVVTSLGSFVLVTGAACAAVASGGTIMSGVIGGMLTGLATNMVDSQFKRLRTLLIKTPASKLNNDLEELISRAVILTLRNIGKSYKNEIRQDIWEEVIKKTINRLINDVKVANEQSLLNQPAVVQHIDEAGSEEGIVQLLFTEADKLPTIHPHHSFSDFFKKNFVPNLQLCFGELLKDPKNHKALVDYQRNIMVAIQQNSRDLLQKQEALQHEFKDSQATLQTVLQQLSEKTQELATAEDTQLLRAELEQYLQPLRQEVTLLVTLTGEIRDEVKEIKEIAEENQRGIEAIREQVAEGKTALVNKYLGKPPYFTEVFLGREYDLTAIHQKLFEGNNLLLLVNGEGGIGKTTLAARYYYTYQKEYAHLAWVFAERSLAEALLTLAIPLSVSFETQQTSEGQLDALLDRMRQLPKPSLLIVDNANRLADLEKHYSKLRSFPNFHVLLTTRITEFEQATLHKVTPLSDDEAKALFTRHYSEHKEEDCLLQQLLEAIGKNTLVIELLAKNLRNHNRLKPQYSLRDLLGDLQQKGLFNVQSKEVSTTYQAENDTFRKEKPEDIIAAMYDLGELSLEEQTMMGIMSVLPAENIPFDTLEPLLPAMEDFGSILLGLAQQGWLEWNETQRSFKISPVVQEVVRAKNEKLRVLCRPLIEGLIEKLWYESSTKHLLKATHEAGAVYTHYANHILNRSVDIVFDKPTLFDRIGNFYSMTGNLNIALECYQKYNYAAEELCHNNPQNAFLQKELAMSYSKLGEIHSSLGNPAESLKHFRNETVLFVQLYRIYQQNTSLHHGLSVSYSRLGDAYLTSGELAKALKYYKQSNQLIEQLCQAASQNIRYKSDLALSYSKLGNAYSALNPNEALEYYRNCTVLLLKLYKAEPQNIAFKNRLASSYEVLRGAYLDLGNNLSKALAYSKKYVFLSEELYQSNPQNVEFKNGLILSYIKMGEIYEWRNELHRCLPYYQKARLLLTEWIKQFPQYVDFKKHLNWIKQKLGEE